MDNKMKCVAGIRQFCIAEEVLSSIIFVNIYNNITKIALLIFYTPLRIIHNDNDNANDDNYTVKCTHNQVMIHTQLNAQCRTSNAQHFT